MSWMIKSVCYGGSLDDAGDEVFATKAEADADIAETVADWNSDPHTESVYEIDDFVAVRV